MRTITPPTTPTKRTTSSAVSANITPEMKVILHELVVIHPDSFTTKQAASYLSQIKGIPTAKSTLEVFRCRNRGPRYRKIGSRVFYSLTELDRYAHGVEIRIFDPSAS